LAPGLPVTNASHTTTQREQVDVPRQVDVRSNLSRKRDLADGTKEGQGDLVPQLGPLGDEYPELGLVDAVLGSYFWQVVPRSRVGLGQLGQGLVCRGSKCCWFTSGVDAQLGSAG